MAIDPSIAMNVQAPNVASAISSGFQTGERIGTKGIREQLLEQQAAAGSMGLEQAKQNQAIQGVKNFANIVDGLASIPDMAQRVKILAQKTPMLEEAGIPASQITSIDLTDNGIRNLQATMKPFMSKIQGQASTPAAIQEYQFYNNVLASPDATDDQKQAARIALKLEGPAKTYAPKVVDIGGAKYLQVGNEFFNPTTMDPVATNEQGIPVAGGEPQVLTPDIQRSMRAEEAAAITSAKEGAKVEAKEGTREAQEMQGKKLAQSQKALGVIDGILGSDRLDNVTGLTGRFPFSTGKTSDLLGQVQQLKSMLTADNLGIMTGVLSESDIKIIEGLSNDIRMITDEGGNVTRIDGSYEGTVNKLKQIRREMVGSLNRNGFYVEGQVITNPDTGERLVYRNGQWSK